ncbi:MAG: hypothetical protein PHP82_04490 [Candidatus ainarchaeum sp.]|nr:hypothetical protein [Candidatus ainarchaeum sp.]
MLLKNNILFKKLNNNGFVITSDSFLSLTLLFLLILASIYYVSQIGFSSWNNIDLINSARDLSIVFEKGLYFENAIAHGSSELLLEKINSTPQSFCFETSIIPEGEVVPIIIASKVGCSKNYEELIVVNRSIVFNDSNIISFYNIRVEAWYK